MTVRATHRVFARRLDALGIAALLLVLATQAWAADPDVVIRSETVAQIRQNFYGQVEVPFFQYFYIDAGERDGTVGAQAYVGIEHAFGTTVGDVDLYLIDFHLTDPSGRGRVVVGRQLVRFPNRVTALDGVHLEARVADHLALRTYVGAGRHMDLDDLRDGELAAGIRASLIRLTPIAAGAGVHFAVAPGEKPRLIIDADVLGRPRAPWAPRPYGRFQFSPEVGQVRLARGGVRLSPRPWIGLDAHGGYRRSTDLGALFGEQILGTIAPEGLFEAGATASIRTRKAANFSVGYDFTYYPMAGDTSALGHAVDVRAVTPLSQRIALGERYAYRSGPGGSYHTLGVLSTLTIHRRFSVDVQAAVAPYQKGFDPWALAVHGTVDLSVRPVDALTIRGGVDVGSDAEYGFDLRGTVMVIFDERVTRERARANEERRQSRQSGAVVQ